LFLDDDAWLPEPNTLRAAVDRFVQRPRLGAVQLRVIGDDGRTMRRWVPRAHVGDPVRSGPAFALAEGVTIVRRRAFEEVGQWGGEFFYGHEGVDLAWKLWDAGWIVHYDGGLYARHPTAVDDRPDLLWYSARNRVWVARRNLPAPLMVLYLLDWMVITHLRLAREPASLGTWWRGFASGWTTACGTRRPIRWRTVAHLARLGQPPII
ncbi:MAG: glycosyltransferase family 2 protein, partial [Actinomycetes bacterium]